MTQFLYFAENKKKVRVIWFKEMGIRVIWWLGQFGSSAAMPQFWTEFEEYILLWGKIKRVNIHFYNFPFWNAFQGLPITQWEHIEENTGSWETVFIPVTSPHNSHSHSPTSPSFSARATYTLKNLRSGAVYDIVAKAKNKFGWSQLSKVFNFFNKGVGKCSHVLSEGQFMPLHNDFNHKIMNCLSK